MYLFFTDTPNVYVDISETIDIKLAALREHASQIRKPDELEEMLRGWSAEAGTKIGVSAAEGFRQFDIG
jgi:LmbE family N-acetylglucosaminyl deacetylase